LLPASIQKQYLKITAKLKNGTDDLAASAKRIQKIIQTEDAASSSSRSGGSTDGNSLSVASGNNEAGNIESTAGTILWSGELDKNSILVLTKDKASIGSVKGRLPGRPVQVEVEPKELSIRQMPDRANGWSQIVLYSGKKKYTSIKIRWSIIQ